MQLNNKFISWFSWGISTSFVLLQFFLQAAAGLMASSWHKKFDLSPTELGYLTAAFYLSYVFMQIPVGLCYDRFRAKHVLAIASALLTIGVVGLACSQLYWQAFASRVIMGVGSSFGFVGMLCITSAWFSTNRFTLLIGISETLAMLGVALTEIIMGWVIAHFGWRIMMLISGVIIGILHILIIVIVKDPESPQLVLENKMSIGSSISKVVMSSIIWKAGLYGFAIFSIINVVVSLWGIPFLHQAYPQYSLQFSSILMSMVFLGTAIGAPLNGVLASYYDRRLIMATFAFMVSLLFACFIYIPALSTVSLGALLLLIGFFCSSYIQVFAVIREEIAKPLQATALAAVNMILMSSAPILQPLIGSMLERHFSYKQSLSVLEILLIIALFLSFSFNKQIISKKE